MNNDELLSLNRKEWMIYKEQKETDNCNEIENEYKQLEQELDETLY